MQDNDESKKRIAELEAEVNRLKEVEKEMRMSEDRFKALFEWADDAIFTTDLKGNFTYGNRKSEEISGYKREEMIGRSFLNLLDKSTVPMILGLFKDIVEQKHNVYTFESKIKTKQGILVPVEIKGGIMKEDDRIIGVMGIARDITENKKITEELEQKNKELAEFKELAVGREIKMIELKNKIKELEEKLAEKE